MMAFVGGIPFSSYGFLQGTVCTEPPQHARESVQRMRPSRLRVSPCSLAVAGSPADLSTEQQTEWQEVVTEIKRVSPELSESDVDKLVQRAFGWGTQKFWRGRMKKQPASIDTTTAAITFLQDVVGIDDIAIARLIPKFPELVGLSTTRMRENVNHIQRLYPHIKGKLLANSIINNPAVLGYDFDCEGDCQSECARCWVQF